jgi:LPXTG-motif cell wall-anchored protein
MPTETERADESKAIESCRIDRAIWRINLWSNDLYAMMLAGLGLLGFVARRRKQKASSIIRPAAVF